MDEITDVAERTRPQESLKELAEELQQFLRDELREIIGLELSRALAKELPRLLQAHGSPHLAAPQNGNGINSRTPSIIMVGHRRPTGLLMMNGSPRVKSRSSEKRLTLQSEISGSSEVPDKLTTPTMLTNTDDPNDDDCVPFLHRKPKLAKELYDEFEGLHKHNPKEKKEKTPVKEPRKPTMPWGVARKHPAANHADHPVVDETEKLFQLPKTNLRDAAAAAPGLTVEDAEPPTEAPAELVLTPQNSDPSADEIEVMQVASVDVPGAVNDETVVQNGGLNGNGHDSHVEDFAGQRRRVRYSGELEASEGGFRDLRAMYLKKRGKNMDGIQRTLSLTSWDLDTNSSRSKWKRGLSGLIRPDCKDFVESLEHFVKGTIFSTVTTGLLILNAVSIGVQTNWMAQNRMKSSPSTFEVVEIFFCIAFSIELALRIMVYRREFFCAKEWLWNWFDFSLVALQVVEVFLIWTIGAADSQGGENVDTNVSFLRVLRVLRLIRVARVVRVIRLISELRTIIASVANSMKSLLSTMVLIGALVYITGVFLTQLVTDKLRSNPEDKLAIEELEIYYSSLPLACLMLFQSFTSGVDWAQACTPLMNHISPFMGLLFVFFIAFVVFAMLNVITGVFVDSAVQSTAEEKDAHMVSRLHTFLCKDDNGDGMLTWERFQARLDDPEIQLYFQTVDLDISEARGLFQLLDAEQNGAVEAEEFVMGCLRLRGQAKAIDLATLMYESRRWHKRISKNMRKVETQNAIILEVLDVGGSSPPTPRPVRPTSGDEAESRDHRPPKLTMSKKMKTWIAES